jgi:hypothetical protein
MRQQFSPGLRIGDEVRGDEALCGKAMTDTIGVFHSTPPATLGFRHQSVKSGDSLEKPQ